MMSNNEFYPISLSIEEKKVLSKKILEHIVEKHVNNSSEAIDIDLLMPVYYDFVNIQTWETKKFIETFQEQYIYVKDQQLLKKLAIHVFVGKQIDISITEIVKKRECNTFIVKICKDNNVKVDINDKTITVEFNKSLFDKYKNKLNEISYSCAPENQILQLSELGQLSEDVKLNDLIGDISTDCENISQDNSNNDILKAALVHIILIDIERPLYYFYPKLSKKGGLGGLFYVGKECSVEKIRNLNFAFAIRVTTNTLFESLRKAQIKSAIAAIMSRNMSHNLGSHVFYYTRQRFIDIFEKEKGEDSFNYPNDIKGIGWFLHYVQERQDFVANINSGDKYNFGPLNLKQDVIDEIAPDAMDFRHLNSTDRNRQSTKNFLLENIVRSEDIARHFNGVSGDSGNSTLADLQLEVTFLESKDNQIQEKPISFAVINNSDNINNNKQVYNEFYNINLAVQGGQQSRHAFLIILENIIRNSAKHAFNKDKHKELKISIAIEKEVNDYRIKIYDNTGNADAALTKLQTDLKNIKLLDDKTNEIDRNNKGLKEILTCILWMKDLDFADIEKHAKEEKILKIEKYKENIAYSFSLPQFEEQKELTTEDLVAINQDKKLEKHAFIFTANIDDEFATELTKRLPRFVTKKESDKSLWKILHDNNYKKLSEKNKLVFDKYSKLSNTENVVIASNSDVNLTQNKEKAIIHFHNHMAKNKDSLVNALTTIKQDNPFPILESLSGANQAFNLMQRFSKDINESYMDNLYWNTIINYRTKIVIVDERLSKAVKEQYFDLEQDVAAFDIIHKNDENNVFLKEIFKKSGLSGDRPMFIENCNSGDIYSEINRRYSSDTVKKKYALVNTELQIKYSNIPLLPKKEQDPYEKFKFQQNTFPFNLDIETNKLVNSKGDKDNPFLDFLQEVDKKYKVDFFTIHIGLIDKIKKEKKDNSSTWSIVTKILDENKIESRFVCVHSGRGGLNDKNDNITFVPFSILQRCFEDSKFLLSEFFYNNQYIPQQKS